MIFVSIEPVWKDNWVATVDLTSNKEETTFETASPLRVFNAIANSPFFKESVSTKTLTVTVSPALTTKAGDIVTLASSSELKVLDLETLPSSVNKYTALAESSPKPVLSNVRSVKEASVEPAVKSKFNTWTPSAPCGKSEAAGVVADKLIISIN